MANKWKLCQYPNITNLTIHEDETSPELFPNRLALQGLHIEIVCSSRHNEEGNNGHVTVTDLQQIYCKSKSHIFLWPKHVQKLHGDTKLQTHTYSQQIVESG